METITKEQAAALLSLDRQNGDAIVTFHIGRGRNGNGGHKTFSGHFDFGRVLSNEDRNIFPRLSNEKDIREQLVEHGIEHSVIDAAINAAANGDSQPLISLGIDPEDIKLIYTDQSDNYLCDFEHDGTGSLDFDGDYDTTYSCKVSDCNEDELMLIVDHGYDFEDAYRYALASLVEDGIIEVEEEE